MRIAASLLLAAGTLAAQVTYDDITKSPNSNWLTYAGDYRGLRHSPLTQINRTNAASVVPQWTYRIPKATRLEATPLVSNGVMYITSGNEVHALDAATGRPIWMYRDDRAARTQVNRGVALYGDKVFAVTADCFLYALDRRSGAVAWTKQYADEKDGYYCTSAPLAVKDRVIVGVGGGDSGMRGFLASFHPDTAEEQWRFWTIPSKGEPGSESWGEKTLKLGGAATWLTGTYDPDLNLLYWTTGNPWPDLYDDIRPGDNLYSCSLVAIDAATGKLKWHFQFTPHDTHDWDAQSWPILINRTVKGKPRKAVAIANRNGFFYTLDRTTGEFLLAKQLVDLQTWAKGIDAKGRPIEIENNAPDLKGNRACPSLRGAANWMSSSYNPATGLIYIPTFESCDVYTKDPREPEPFKNSMGGTAEAVPTNPGKFFLRALDPTTGERKWQYPMTGPGNAWPGTVTTAGGLVFFADDDGHLVAVDAATGKHLWHFSIGDQISASPMVYSVKGKQYVAIAAHSGVHVFGLFAPARPLAVPKGLETWSTTK